MHPIAPNNKATPAEPPRRTPPSLRNRAFTLVELLVVVAVIAIVVSILVPAVTRAIDIAAASRTRARMQAIGQGAHQFKGEFGYFPGQNPQDENDLLNDGYGSALLGKFLFYDEKNDKFPAEKYVAHSEGTIAIEDDWGQYDYPKYTLLDNMDESMAVCYYPSIPGKDGLGQYDENDNREYTDGNTGEDSFDDFILDERFEGDENRPYKPGEFLLIAPGLDRKYFTTDDITNW